MTSTVITPRKRSLNFSTEEELMLLEEVDKFKATIECKVTNRVSYTDKNEAWKIVANNFNAKSRCYRTLEQMKGKYENLKTKARKFVATNKLSLKITGGGPSSNPSADPVIEAVLNIINYKTVYGTPSAGDSDFVEEVPEEGGCGETAETASVVNEQILEKIPIVIAPPEVNNPIVHIRDAEYVCNSTLENAETSVFGSSAVPALSEKVKAAVNKEITASQKPKQNNWSNYTGHKLKQPVNKRLRPNIPNATFTEKEEYYKAKKQCVEEEILLMKAKAQREVEEHLKRQTLLDLQVQLATKQLNDYI